MKKICLFIICLCVTFAAFSWTMEDGGPQSDHSSRAWYVMRQSNVGPLLLGLTQRLGKVIESSKRNDFIWNGTEQGGSLKINIAVEGNASGEIFIGLFRDPNWSSEPVQVRCVPGPGEYMIENLPPGEFQIGTMIGSLPMATALGVHQTWPKPVEIEQGKTNYVNVLVSRDFQLSASGRYNNMVSRDFIRVWKDIDPNNFLQGRVTGPGGEPIAFATVYIREYDPGASSISAPNRGTNTEGYYRCDDISWPYRLGVTRYMLMPSILGYCHQSLFYNRVFEGYETINFQFDRYPVGDSTVKGQVLDNKGNPLKEFFVSVTTKTDRGRENPDGKFYSSVGYRVPFISEDGTFKLDGLPSGDFMIGVNPFDKLVYETHRGEEVKLMAGQTTTVNLKVLLKNVFYGRVLFRDGSPAVIQPTPWPGAKTLIRISRRMSLSGVIGITTYDVAELDDKGYFSVHLSDKEVELLKSGTSRLIINVPTSEEGRRKTMGEFPDEVLSGDKDKAGILRIARPDTKPLVLIDNSLSGFEGIEITFDMKDAQNKMILVCFFDMEQRPSRNCIRQLIRQAEKLKQKDIVIVAVQASKLDEKELDEWIKGQEIPFPIGIIQLEEEEIRSNWGVKSLPWLILTDKNHVVSSNGFPLNELDEKIQSAQK